MIAQTPDLVAAMIRKQGLACGARVPATRPGAFCRGTSTVSPAAREEIHKNKKAENKATPLSAVLCVRRTRPTLSSAQRRHMPHPAASRAADATDAPPARLGAGLNWTNIGASDPEELRRRRAALLARLDAEWRAAQASWAAYRAARWPGRVFERSA